MQTPVSIVARNQELPEALASDIRVRAAQLEHFFERLVGCRVAVEGPGGHHRRGKFKVQIRLMVPGPDIIINRQSDDQLSAAIAEAFGAAERKLKEYARILRGDVKTSGELPRGRVLRLFSDYGFLDAGGREIYFHRNSVVDGRFERLAVGDEVRFAEEEGEEGPQATTVVPVGRSH
jgi:cold shock CspA family protein/ribosome-associated translation inhibitor RaiA